MKFNYPERGYHTTILGTTGSSKSTLGAWLLSRAPFHAEPHFIIDYKDELIFRMTKRVREIDTKENIPSQPGLYILRPRPDMIDEVESWLEKLWHHGASGLYIDEGYLIPDKAWLRNVLAQGRSRGITVTACSQRPVDVSRFFFTEASYVAVFRLNDRKDMQRVAEFTPPGMLEKRLPDYHSFWYSPKHHRTDDPVPYVLCSPVPGAELIAAAIDARLTPQHTLI